MISIDEVRRRLPVGAEFTVEQLSGTDREATRRRVKTQTPLLMVSTRLDGSKPGEDVYLGWKWKEARLDDDGNIILTDTDTGRDPPEDFLKIVVCEPSVKPAYEPIDIRTVVYRYPWTFEFGDENGQQFVFAVARLENSQVQTVRYYVHGRMTPTSARGIAQADAIRRLLSDMATHERQHLGPADCDWVM